MKPSLKSATVSLSFAIATTLCAQTSTSARRLASPAADDLGTGGTLPDTVVTAQADRGYVAAEATSATKTKTPILETPQAVSVVTRELMTDRNDRTLADALTTVPGVTERENYFFADEFTLRGFFIDSADGYYLDGRRIFNDVAYDTYMLERIEIVRGPASVLYGGMEPGGLVAMTSKRPLAERRFALETEVGSWNDYRVSADVSLPFGKDGRSGIRVPFTYRHYDTFRDFVDDNHVLQTAPQVVFGLGPDTDLTLSLFYTDQARVNDNIDIPILNGKPVDIPRERFLGEPGVKERIEYLSGAATFTHRFTPTLELRSSTYYLHEKDTGHRIVSFFGFEEGSDRLLTRFADRGGDYEAETYGTQLDLTWETSFLGMTHRLLLGGEAYRRTRHVNDLQFGSVPSIDIYRPRFDNTFTAFAPPFSTNDEYSVAGVYLQDQITLAAGRPWLHKLDVLLGARADYFELETYDEQPFGGLPNETSEEFSDVSPRAGLVYMPAKNVSLYGTWSQSFSPQLDAVDADGKFLDPQEAEQWEAGVKWEARPNLFVTAGFFHITKTNVLTETLPGLAPALNGEERSQGFELEIAGEIARGWQVAAAYTYLDAEVTAAGTAQEIGATLASAPEHTIALWTSYTHPCGVGGGVGVRYVSEQVSSPVGGILVDGYTLAQASLWYRPKSGPLEGFSAQLSVRNIFDEEYFFTGNSFGTSVSAGEPRAVSLTVGYEF